MAAADVIKGEGNAPPVEVSNTAQNMIHSLYGAGTRKKTELARIISSVQDPSNVQKLYRGKNGDTFIAKAGKLRVIFRQTEEVIYITSVMTMDD